MSTISANNIKPRTGNSVTIDGNVTGDITATNVSGNGANVTNLNATQLASGTIPDARFPATLPAVSGANLTGIDAAPSYTGVASGSLSNGAPVIITDDGKLTAVSGSSATEEIGSMTTFESAAAETFARSVCKTQNANQIVIAYQDSGNSSHGNAVVGTITGTSIVFGTPVVFEAANTQHISCTFDENAGRVVIAYYDYANASYGTAIVGTVSGTGSGATITFGTPVVYHSNTTYWNTLVYDSNAQKVCVGYRGAGNSNHATARVGTVDPSDNSITFGTEVTMAANGIEFLNGCFDSTLNKVVYVFRDTAGNTGDAVVGTITGTDVAFGTPVTFNSANTEYTSCSYDVGQQKVVVAYRDRGNSDYGTARVGTVGGNSISFSGSETAFNTADTNYTRIAYNFVLGKHVVVGSGPSHYYIGTVTGNEIEFTAGVDLGSSSTPYMNIGPETNTSNSTFVITFRDGNDSNYGKAQVLVTPFVNTNLTAGNFLGFSDAAYTDGQNAKVQLVGSIDDAQVGLTTGRKYYVRANGTLSTTADAVNVTAGISVSETQIIVKG